jgi:hypothetical protein
MAWLKRRLTAEESVVVACTRQAPLPEHRQTVLALAGEGAFKWDSVYDIATRHGVTPLVYANLLRFSEAGLSLPEEAMHRFKLSAARNAIEKKRRATRVAEALQSFNEQGVEVMLVKGAALDLLVYEEPWYTVPYDIDLILRPTRAELEARELPGLIPLLEGYGVEYDFFAHHDIVMNGVLPVDFQQIWKDAIPGSFLGQRAYLMSTEDMLIALCINSCRKRFFRLKAVCDLAESIARLPDLDWDLLVEKAGRYQVSNIVFAALRVTQSTLGCKLPANVFNRLDVGTGRRKMIDFLIDRMSLSAYVSLDTGYNLMRRNVAWQLLLPYATLRWDQIWRRLRYVWRTKASN